MNIWQACRYGGHRYVERYVDKGYDIEAKDPVFGQTPLMWASDNGQKNIVELLAEKGADIEAKNNDGRAVPYVSLYEGRLSVGEYLAHLAIPNPNTQYSDIPTPHSGIPTFRCLCSPPVTADVGRLPAT